MAITKAKDILDDASKLISEDRHVDHGPADASFERIAKLWSIILDKPLQPHQVAQCMIALKLSRINHQCTHMDNWKDIAGYAALGGEMARQYTVLGTSSTAPIDIDKILINGLAPSEFFSNDEAIYHTSSDILDVNSVWANAMHDTASDDSQSDLFFWGDDCAKDKL